MRPMKQLLDDFRSYSNDIKWIDRKENPFKCWKDSRAELDFLDVPLHCNGYKL